MMNKKNCVLCIRVHRKQKLFKFIQSHEQNNMRNNSGRKHKSIQEKLEWK